MAARWTTEISQVFMTPIISYSLPSTPFPGDDLVLGVASTHYYEKHNVPSTTFGWSVALITINGERCDVNQSVQRGTGTV